MKKVLALVMALVLLFAFAGCGKEEKIEYKILDEILTTEKYGIGFKLGNTELRDAIQAGLYQLLESGKIAEIAEKYSDNDLDEMLCLNAEEATKFDMNNASQILKDRKKLIVGFDSEYPPYGYLGDDGEYTGFDLELAEEICKIYGWELVKQPIDWNTKDVQLDSGNIDVIWNGFTINGREDLYTWSVPYLNNKIVVVVDKKSDIKTLDDLKGKVVVTQTDSSAETALLEGGERADLAKTFKELKSVADYNTAFMDLEAGSVDAIAVDIGVAQYQLSKK